MSSRFVNWVNSQAKTVSDAVSGTKQNWVATNTLSGSDVAPALVSMLSKSVTFFADEKLLYLWAENKSFSAEDNVFVGITNYRVFKLEDDEITQQMREYIATTVHVENNFASWDQLKFVIHTAELLKDDPNVTESKFSQVPKYNQTSIHIFHKDAAKFFANYLNANKPDAVSSESYKSIEAQTDDTATITQKNSLNQSKNIVDSQIANLK